MNKIFGIGFHKTGTSSLGRALQILGYKNCHGAGHIRNFIGHDNMMRKLKKGDLDDIWIVADQFDSFQDNPWQIIFQCADKKYSNSKFILTVRDPDSWYKSVVNHFKNTETDFRKWVYGEENGSPVGNKMEYIRRYEKHNEDAVNYFQNRKDDLLVMDLEKCINPWESICEFLNQPLPQVPFPYVNKGNYQSLLGKFGKWLSG